MSPQQGLVPATKSRATGVPRASNSSVQIQIQANERDTNGPGNGLFIRHRTNAASVRLRRRRNGEEATFATPIQVPKRYHRLSGGDFEDNWEMENQRNLQRMRNYRPRAYSEDWDAISDDEFENDDEEERHDIDPDRVRRNAPERKSLTGLCSNRSLLKASPMETLDRRISVSTDQLDTLQRNKRDKQSFRAPPRAKSASRQQLLDNIENEFESDRLRSQQPFESPGSGSGESDRKAPRKTSGHGSSGRGVSAAQGLKSKLLLGVVANKTSRSKMEKFLDEGPYSRRLYGPPPPELSSSAQIDEERRKRTRSQEYLHNEVAPHDANQDDDEGQEPEDEVEEQEDDHAHRAHSLHHQQQQQQHQQQQQQQHPHHYHPHQQQQQPEHHHQHHIVHFKEEPANVQKKGLLWQQRDKLFSRWKERYFILTKDYFHCFKKGSSRMTEMGGFIFKLKLLDIDSVDLLDKRGYLTICISLLKEGKIYLRRPEGIKEWYTTLQTHIYDCKRKRKFWVDSSRQITDSTGIEQWLLSRQKVGGTTNNTPSGNQFGYSASNPNIMDSSSSGFSSAHSGTTAPNSRHTSVERPNNISSGARHPFTISRSQILDKNNNENMDHLNDFDRRGFGDGLEAKKRDAGDFMTARRERIMKDEKLSKTSHEMAHNASDPPSMLSAYSSGPRSIDNTKVKLTTSISKSNGLSQSPQLQIHSPKCQQPIQPPPQPQPPRGINRMLLVNELILKEQLVGEDSCSKSGGGTTDECSSSDMDMSTTTTTKSSSPRSTMQIVASMSPPNKSILRIKKVSDDSGHDSGHNSMHTNSSDSNSDGGTPEDHSACPPSMKNGGTTSVVTINGTSVKQPYSSLEDSLILSSDISSTPAELRASKSNFIRFRDKSCIATSSLRNPLYRKTYSLGQVITDL